MPLTDSELIRACTENGMLGTPVEWSLPANYVGYIYTHPNPLVFDADAFQLLDALMARGWWYRIDGSESHTCVILWCTGGDLPIAVSAGAMDRRRAIVLACLKAMGETV